MPLGRHIADQALALVGTPFRLRGRDPRTGLDCVGLALMAMERAGVAGIASPAYQLRGTSLDRAAALLDGQGFWRVETAEPGDLLLVETGPMQLHLLIQCGAGHVHAHAGIGRVVLTPPPLLWPLRGIWRAFPPSTGLT